MNASWIKEQFAEHLAEQEQLCENGIEIQEQDVLDAMKKIGTKKAPSYDGMTDVIF